MQTLYYLNQKNRKILRKLTAAKDVRPLDAVFDRPPFDEINRSMFHELSSSLKSEGSRMVMVPSYARRLQATILPSGAMDPRALPAFPVVQSSANIQMDIFRVLCESVPLSALYNPQHPSARCSKRLLWMSSGLLQRAIRGRCRGSKPHWRSQARQHRPS